MATSRDVFVFTSENYVNNEQANDAIAKMTKRMADLNAEYERIKTEKRKVRIHQNRKDDDENNANSI